jgi:anti-sigma regulatory factor (Ser/Thr protein kinase)
MRRVANRVPGPLLCRVRQRLPVAVVTMEGRLDESSVVGALVSLRDCLADQPTALVLEASGLSVSGPLALAPVLSLAERAWRWPGASVVMCRAAPAVRDLVPAQANGGGLRLCDDPDEALRRAGSRPVPPRLEVRMSPGPDAPAACRRMVDEACRDWEVPRLRRLGRLIVSELATNAVLHAGTPMVVTLRLLRSEADRTLRVAIRDNDPRLVERLPEDTRANPPKERGRGLLILDAMADAWGSEPTADGKVVWAEITSPQSSQSTE